MGASFGHYSGALGQPTAIGGEKIDWDLGPLVHRDRHLGAISVTNCCLDGVPGGRSSADRTRPRAFRPIDGAGNARGEPVASWLGRDV
jgi:hypothetical protein